jgi:hypothetical protein
MVSVSQSVSQLPRSYSYRIHTKYKPRRHARRARRLHAGSGGGCIKCNTEHAMEHAPRQGLLLAWALAALGVSRLPATSL